MRLNVEVYIGNDRLDLYEDENIEINRTVKDFRELDRVFSDYTQAFTIPASKQNNIVMSHWYNESIATGFNPATKKAARIDINTLPFRSGYIWLNRAVLKNGSVDYYEIEFFSEMTNLTDVFGKDTIPELGTQPDSSNQRLAYNQFDNAIENTINSGKKMIPLATSQRNWNLSGRGNGIYNSINYKPYTGEIVAGQYTTIDNRLTIVPSDVRLGGEEDASFYDTTNNWFIQSPGTGDDIFAVAMVPVVPSQTYSIKVRDAANGFSLEGTISPFTPLIQIAKPTGSPRFLALQFSEMPSSDFTMTLTAIMGDTGDRTSITNTYKYASQGGLFYELKPALRADIIRQEIQNKYSLNLTGNFWTSDAWLDLYAWSNRAQGFGDHYKMDYVHLIGGDVEGDGSANWNTTTGIMTVPANSGTVAVKSLMKVNQSQFEEVNDSLPIPKLKIVCMETTSGSEVLYDFVYAEPSAESVYDFSFTNTGGTAKTFKFYVKSNYPEKFNWGFISGTAQLNFYAHDENVEMDTTSSCQFRYFNHQYTDTLTNEIINIDGGLPDQSINEWLQAIIKMFNLIILPVDSNTFQVETFDYWKSLGSNVDITEYVDVNEVSVEPADLYNELAFKFSPTDSVIGRNYAQLNGDVGYGDSITEIRDSLGDAISSETFELTVPFENPSWSRLTNFAPVSANGSFLSKLMVLHYIDSDFSTIGGQPVLMYRAGTQDLSIDNQTAFAFRNFYQSQILIDPSSNFQQYNVCYQYNGKDNTYTHSLNFGAEVNPFTLETDTATSPTVYKTFWEDYITDLYDLSMRRTMLKAILPLHLMLEIKVNDVLTISAKKFTINNMRLNLTTGEAMFELLTLVE